MQIEESRDYNYPNYVCFKALVEEAIQNLDIKYEFGYSFLKMPNLTWINLKVIESEPQAGFIKAKLQFKAYNLIPSVSSPLIKIYCIHTGNNTCSVEVIAESATYSDIELLNFSNDISAKIPGVSTLSFIAPRLYVDGIAIMDPDTYKAKSPSEEMGKRLLKYVFNKLHKLLDQSLQKRYPKWDAVN